MNSGVFNILYIYKMKDTITILTILGITLLYFLPTYLSNKNKLATFIVNLLFGWSILGWLIALAMAIIPQLNNNTK